MEGLGSNVGEARTSWSSNISSERSMASSRNLLTDSRPSVNVEYSGKSFG